MVDANRLSEARQLAEGMRRMAGPGRVPDQTRTQLWRLAYFLENPRAAGRKGRRLRVEEVDWGGARYFLENMRAEHRAQVPAGVERFLLGPRGLARRLVRLAVAELPLEERAEVLRDAFVEASREADGLPDPEEEEYKRSRWPGQRYET